MPLSCLTVYNNFRFRSTDTGLTPSEHSSGPSVRRGHITRQGNSRVRFVLCEAAWRAIRKDESLRDFFNRLHPRTGKKKAIVAVARKLIGRIRAAFRQEKLYQLQPIS
ncbi:MAG: transposase [Cyanobacteria bacterium J06626_18]